MQTEDITVEKDGAHKVVVTYYSSSPIDIESLDGEDIWVVSRNGYNRTGVLGEVVKFFPFDVENGGDGIIIDDRLIDPPIPANGVRATYMFKPGTGDSWDAEDNGEYAVLLQRKQVLRKDGTAFPSQLLGYFGVRVGEVLPLLPASAELNVRPVAVSDAAGVAEVHYVAHLKVFYRSRDVEVTSWGEVRRDGNGFFVDIEAYGTPDLNIDPGPRPLDPPIVVKSFEHTYRLGVLDPGEYKMLVTSFDEKVAEDEWVVREPDPDPRPAFPREVAIDVRTLPQIAIFPPPPAQYVADVKLIFHQRGRVEIESWGEAVIEGNTIKAEVRAVVHPGEPWPGPDPNEPGDLIIEAGEDGLVAHIPQIFRNRYEIGVLDPGEYRFVLTSRGRTLGTENFRVRDPDPGIPPAEVDLDVVTREDHAVVRARIQFDEIGWVLTDPGQVERADDATFVINASAEKLFGPFDPNGGEPGDPLILFDLRNQNPVYRIGPLDPGEYKVLYQINGHDFAKADFEIRGGGGGGDPPQIHDIVIHEGDASWAAEVFVVLPEPGLHVLDWGEVKREGNEFFVTIRVGRDPVPDPVLGGGLVADGEPFHPDGIPREFPIRLVSHVYNLGQLEEGGYAFSVLHEGEPIFTKEWKVDDGNDNKPPQVRVDVGAIEEPKDEAHRFGVQYTDRSGLDHDSIQEATLWVVNERLGYRAEARLLSYAQTEDIPSTGASARYEVDAPGGSWDVDDRGVYVIHVEPEKVRDLQGNHLEESAIGRFKVSIWPEPPGFPKEAKIEVGQNDAGEWGAKVAIELPDELAAPDDWTIDWGDVRHYGHVLVAVARYHKIGERPNDNLDEAFGILPPDDGGGTQTVRHTYDIGALREGRYLFVFISNLGHFGKERFNVGQVEDGGGERDFEFEIPPFVAWQAAAFMPGDWAALPQLVEANANPDGDPWSNFEEYAFGLNPLRRESVGPPVSCEIVSGERGDHLAIRYREMLAADDVEYRVMGSSNLRDWEDITGLVDVLERAPSVDGTIDVLACLRGTLDEHPYTHLRILARPMAIE